ncbi:LAME_0E04236g1_1 [Lachancea meyersii CBS 8951]|uniref:Kinase n=1 Tax=Lachancea meyersii CBS 8951 TaxID=1266667 RepID=A0A1G4JGT4_9SACH|nr:LAME_0E04236g1_1 [Lachancea meyersii CBS 8951]
MDRGYVKARHQAAGHDGNFTDQQETLFFKPTNSLEVEFYENVNRNIAHEDNGDVDLQSWMPAFLGTLTLGVSENVSEHAISRSADPELPKIVQSLQNEPSSAAHRNKPIIVLENLLQSFKSPNILDVKLGKVLHDDLASEDKKLRLQKVSSDTTSGSLGFRICGLKIQKNSQLHCLDPDFCKADEDGYVAVNKFYGRSLTARTIKDAFELYFAHDALSQQRRNLLYEVFQKRLMLLYNTLLNEDVRLISSSLLFIYEGDLESWEELDDKHNLLRDEFNCSTSDSEEEEVANKCLSSLSLIDFAHSRFVPGQGYDENVLIGVESLLNIFETLTEP